MRNFQIPELCLGLILLAACGTTGGGPESSPIAASLSAISKFTLADLQSADAIAQAQDPQDVLAHACFVVLEAFVENQQAAPKQSVKGAFSAFEAARAGLQSGLNLFSKQQRQTLEIGCGPLLLDAQSDFAPFLASLAALGAKP